ncbi:leucyl aminopeptidase [Roseospira marina]|uniref:Probable cytosol aminopeptidase n=1 Tax=Roseospira marina TaxID=140057 RepID=A0A5M6IGG0_9PROT|nr:leucyl aminopeptidase [Roseospira marina]KAA5607400.1 leucyl aminopeptidase [Roseospira marina]MBB4312428.1 leucyl aminopeptidase [Roseospira marina]MBB5085556.1 leucyl aminopeptidase [Roseospira marina]
MKLSFAKPDIPAKGALVVGVFDGKTLGATATTLDDLTGGQLSRALASARFSGESGKTLVVPAPHGVTLDRIVLVGLGAPDAVTATTLETMGGVAVSTLGGLGDETAALAVDLPEGASLTAAEAASHAAFGAHLSAFRFDKYRTKETADEKPALTALTLLCDDPAGAETAFEPAKALAEGVLLTRRLVSEPANVIYPETFCDTVADLADLGIAVEVLDEAKMRKLGMGALLGVAQGSARPPRLLVMEYRGAKDKKAPPVAFVGKGVTFDSGGISIKPAAGMEDMKWDMGGAGVVAGLMKALAGRKARANVVGICGLVENMPSGTAQRPGDVVHTMSGQTVEVINTDAEGRLVLADALWYCQDRFKPTHIVDLATLTGAIIISLGSEHAGLFSNDDALAGAITAAGVSVGEKCWRLPLADAYDKIIKSDIADMKNTGNREAGSITAAQFLQRFIKDTPWAHIDIAGVTWSKKDAPTVPKGGTAFGVRLLDRFVRDVIESGVQDNTDDKSGKGKDKEKSAKGKGSKKK